jgi:UDP-N-acetylglucosamine 3-dehydrogenase
VGVIGVGNMGKHHARVYSEIEGTDLVAIADLDKNNGRRIARKFNCRYYDSVSRLLDTENLDAATIAVPTSMHKDVALECIGRGIPVLIDKPIAESVVFCSSTCGRNWFKFNRLCLTLFGIVLFSW